MAGSTAHTRNNETELLNMDTWTWTVSAQFPSNSKAPYQSDGAMVYLYPHFYLIGGQVDNEDSTTQIMSFDEFDQTWQHVGNMIVPREKFK